MILFISYIIKSNNNKSMYIILLNRFNREFLILLQRTLSFYQYYSLTSRIKKGYKKNFKKKNSFIKYIAQYELLYVNKWNNCIKILIKIKKKKNYGTTGAYIT